MVKAKGLVSSEMRFRKKSEVAAAVVMEMNLLMMRDWCWESHCHACGTAKQTDCIPGVVARDIGAP